MMASSRRAPGWATRFCRLLICAAMPMAAWCQTPVITTVVDAASNAPTAAVAGTIVSILGTNLAATTASAQSVPLPRELGGTTVTVSGVAAPLFYVSRTQINFQIPVASGAGSPVGVVVSTAAGSSALYNPWTAPNASLDFAGIFTQDGSGCGQGAVENDALDGNVTLNSPANSASPGGWISAYGTGVTNINGYDPPDGAAAPLTPLYTASGSLQFDIADVKVNQQAVYLMPNAYPPQSWSGFAPGWVGLNQFNAMLPAGVREGCAVPVQVSYFTPVSGISQPVTLAIRNGGGRCVDPPAAGYGQITWQKTVNTDAAGAVTESDTMTASLQASPGKKAPPAPVYCDNTSYPNNCVPQPATTYLFGPSCPVPGYRGLDAGTVTAQGPGLSSVPDVPFLQGRRRSQAPAQGSGLGSAPAPAVPFQEGQVGGLSAYQAALPGGAIQAGKYTVTASGGADVGAFQADLQLGEDIQIQTNLSGQHLFAGCQPLTINWTGGDPDSWVTVSLVGAGPNSQFIPFGNYQTSASKGSVTILPPPETPPPQSNCQTLASGPVTVTVEVDPDPSEIIALAATGLSLGGQATWKYIHTFPAFY